MIKYGLAGAVGGAVILALIGFNWAGWVTAGTAQEMAKQMADDAVVDRLAPICVEQFNQDSEKDQKLQMLKDTTSYQRGGYVETQGWATMPGEKEPDIAVASECASMNLKNG